MERSPPSKIVPLKPPDAQAVKSRLLQTLPHALRALLPAGVVRGQKFMVGNVAGDAGDSLIVELSGSKAGLWHDFATGAGGDVLDLWAEVKGLDRKSQFADLLRDVQASLGAMPSPTRTQPPARTSIGTPTAKWDYTDGDGHVIASVYRYDPRPGQKEFRPWDALRGVMRAPEIRPLFNQVGLRAADTVLLVEGQKCAAALIGIGICATTAMHGAKAPIDKTDWSPLNGKRVIIWPDHDEPGQVYARNAASAAARAGAVLLKSSKSRLTNLPNGMPPTAVAEGLDIAAILKNWERLVAKDPPLLRKTLPLFSIADLQRDSSPMPDDLIAPRILTPGGLLVFGGAPKVGKSDFLIALLAHMAGGSSFLGMTSKRPLGVFYLQAQVQYHYLRERIQRFR